jgi:hypothetical protein
MRGRAIESGAPTRPAELHWYMVFVKYNGAAYTFLVGPWTRSGMVHYLEGGEVLWIKFKLGTFMPHLPTRKFRDRETMLPGAASRQSFWLNGSAWQFPDFDNADTFVNRLVRQEILVCDPLINDALNGHPPNVSPRTLRHRFLRATGLSQNHIFQYERAQQAASLLRQGTPILDTVFETGYFDQSHLTRAIKHFTGFTPAQIAKFYNTAAP